MKNKFELGQRVKSKRKGDESFTFVIDNVFTIPSEDEPCYCQTSFEYRKESELEAYEEISKLCAYRHNDGQITWYVDGAYVNAHFAEDRRMPEYDIFPRQQ